jgi:putative nucleotidyltransferase with HDIG domain
MQQYVEAVRNSHAVIYRLILFLLCIAAIVWVFPKEGKFKYEIDSIKGKVWQHDNLQAPFEFAIKKSTEELGKERDEVIKNSKLYFRFDPKVYEESLAKFKSNLINVSPKVRAQYYNTGKPVLDSVYGRGILQVSDVIENQPPDFEVAVVNGNEEQEREISSFYSVRTADDYIFSTVSKYNHLDKQQLFESLENAIAHNVFYDDSITRKVLNQALENVSPTKGSIANGQTIITKGEIVTQEKYEILQSLKMEYEAQSGGTSNYVFMLIGQSMIVFSCLVILLVFMWLFRRDIFLDNTRITFILFLVALSIIIVHFSLKIERLSIYMLPFCILPIIVRSFYDTRMALFTHLVTILMSSFLAPNRFEFAFIQIVAGIVAIFSIVNMRNRSQVFVAAGIIFVAYSVSYLGITITQEGRPDSIEWLNFAWFGVSAMVTLFSYPLIFVFEKMFGFISDVSMLELSDTNSPLLRELASKAPGTFQHSLQVANLAEEAIYKIGGNPLLVRCGALYHDIGKMEMPMYFIENQVTGVNPHEEMSFDESASIIISHVIRGIEIAKEHNIPDIIIDFIRTHHGTTMTAYFYRSYKKSYPEEKVDESKFRYPGPIPFSKETAVLMMADSVEAASRSLKVYDYESVDQLVENIIDSQIEQDQFVNSDITFRDTTTIKKIFKKKLMNIYHVRVEYPR